MSITESYPVVNPLTLELGELHVETVADGVHHRRGPQYWKTRLSIGERTLELKDAGWGVVSAGAKQLGCVLACAGAHPRLERTGLTGDGGGWIGRRGYLNEDCVYAGTLPMFVDASERRVRELFAAGRLDLAALPTGPLGAPSAHRSGGALAAPRVLAMVTGAAIGDALGNTSESMLPSKRRARFGEIRGYLPNRHAMGKRVGVPSDDTQLTIWTLEANLARGHLELATLTEALRRGPVYGIGATCKNWQLAAATASDPWEARQRSAGNGALMRVLGLFAPHAWTSRPETHSSHFPSWYWDVIFGSALTHDHRSSTAACVGFAAVLELLLDCAAPPSPETVIEAYVAAARPARGRETSEVQATVAVGGAGFDVASGRRRAVAGDLA